MEFAFSDDVLFIVSFHLETLPGLSCSPTPSSGGDGVPGGRGSRLTSLLGLKLTRYGEWEMDRLGLARELCREDWISELETDLGLVTPLVGSAAIWL